MTRRAAQGLSRRAALVWLTAASLLGHLALLALLTQIDGQPHRASRPATALPSSVQGRSVQVRSAVLPDDATVPPLATARPKELAAAASDALTAQPGPRQAEAVPPIRLNEPVNPPESGPMNRPVNGQDERPDGSGTAQGEEYLPRSALSLAPTAQSEVLLDYPPGAPPGLYRGELTLFIDETGLVRRVRIDSSETELPAVFQEAARQAFLTARFTPGELQGRAVKARLRIAVEFEATAPDPSAEDRGPR